MTVSVAFEGRTLRIGSLEVELEFPIAEAFACGDIVIVLLRHDADSRTFGQFPNLVGLTERGERSWVAELPTTDSGDTYVSVSSRQPLVATSWSCHRCTLDPRSGRIVGRVFTK